MQKESLYLSDLSPDQRHANCEHDTDQGKSDNLEYRDHLPGFFGGVGFFGVGMTGVVGLFCASRLSAGVPFDGFPPMII